MTQPLSLLWQYSIKVGVVVRGVMRFRDKDLKSRFLLSLCTAQQELLALKGDIDWVVL